MKITKTNKTFAAAEARKTAANMGCHICPCCGETKSTWDYVRKGIYNKGLSMGGMCKEWCEGIFATRYMRIDCYSCKTCGATWESDPYEI